MRWIRFYMRFKSFYDAGIYHIPQYFQIKFYPEIIPFSKEEIITLNNQTIKQIRGFRWIIEGEIYQLSTSENLLQFLLSNQKVVVDLFAVANIYSKNCYGNSYPTLIPIFYNLSCIIDLDYERHSQFDFHKIKFKLKSNIFNVDRIFTTNNYFHQFWFRILKCSITTGATSDLTSELYFVSLLPNELKIFDGNTYKIGNIITYEYPFPSFFEISNRNYPSLKVNLDLNTAIDLAFRLERFDISENDNNFTEYYFEKIADMLRRNEI
ncbi:MAG: hypothetical protein ABIL37_06150 [candidate division WOR-3 bacterium]